MGFNYAISDAANFTLRNNKTKAIELYTPFANSTAMNFESTQIYAMAKGIRAVRFDSGKQAQLTAALEVFDLKWISILLGGTWTKGVTSINAREVLTASATNTIELEATPKAGSLVIFKLLEDNIGHDTEQVVGTPASTIDTYSISDLVVTLNTTTAPVGTKFVAYYLKDSASTAETIQINADEYPVAYTITGQTMLKSKHDGVIEYIEFECRNATPIGQMNISFESGAVTTIEAVFDLFPDADNNLARITKME